MTLTSIHAKPMLRRGDPVRVAELDIAHAALAQRKTELLKELGEVDQALWWNESERASHFVPVHLLSDDILKHIFEDVCDHPVSEECSENNLPMKLSQVSRWWRLTALSLPNIWRCIQVGWPLSLLEVWLERSGATPIHVIWRHFPSVVSSSSTALPRSREKCAHSLATIFGYAARWVRCDIDVPDTALLKTFLEVFGDVDVPLLEYLRFGDDATCRALLHPYEGYRLPPCPKLAFLSSRAAAISFHTTSFPNLKTLTLQRQTVSIDDLFILSKAAPNLTSLSLLEIEGEFNSGHGRSRVADFPRLETLVLSSISEWEYLLAQLEIPALETFECRHVTLWSTTRLEIDRFPTLPALHCIRFPECTGGDVSLTYNPEVARLFHYTPNVTHLDLTGCTQTWIIVIPLLIPGDSGELLPRLEVLTLGKFDADYDDVLFSFVQRRAPSVAPLKELRVGWKLYENMDPVRLVALGELVTITIS